MTCRYVQTTDQDRGLMILTQSHSHSLGGGKVISVPLSVIENRIPSQYKLIKDKDCFAIINFR